MKIETYKNKPKFVFLLLFVPLFGISVIALAGNQSSRAYQHEKYQIVADIFQMETVNIETVSSDVQLIGESHAQNIEWLTEHKAYPRGYFLLGRNILILTIEDNIPVVKRVDILEGELIIRSETRLARIDYRPERSPLFVFSANQGSISFDNGVFQSLSFSLAGGGNFPQPRFNFFEKIDDEIPEEVFWASSDSQISYVGNFVFDDFLIIQQSNYEITETLLEWFTSVQLVVGLNQDGSLEVDFYPPGGSPLWFNINRLNAWDGRIIPMGGANGAFGGEYRYLYIADENTIYHRFHSFSHPFDWDTGESLPGGHTIEYAIRYIRQ